MEATDDPFLRGELVTLREFPTAAEPLGRIVSVTPNGEQAEVAWHKNPGHDHEVTVEPTQPRSHRTYRIGSPRLEHARVTVSDFGRAVTWYESILDAALRHHQR